MASRLLDMLQVVGKGRVFATGHFYPQGSSALTSANYGGRAVASVARTGVGAFTITLQDGWPNIAFGAAHLCSATLQPIRAQIGTVDLRAKTVTVFLYNTTTGAAADVAADANSVVRFAFVFRNTTIPGA